MCTTTFSLGQLPWPPSPTATPPQGACGSQRPGINVAPAIAPDGTIYTVSRAHLRTRYSYMVAVDADLRPQWHTSLRDFLSDGCNVLLPPNGTPGGCTEGATTGVDPATNERPAGRVIDQSSSSPSIAPDGSILYGSYSRYNFARGHLWKFSPRDGRIVATYDFGWDQTPAVFGHDGTYSIVVKDNHYDVGSYCNDKKICPVAPAGPYYITQLNANLSPEWKFQNTNTFSCGYDNFGHLKCRDDHPGGFEWCINAPAVDPNGVVYANSEDGNLYAINPDGTLKQSKFLRLALGAAYTPLALGDDGKIYTENFGDLFVVGN
jgi:outer membrane protein assembly factor BamB